MVVVATSKTKGPASLVSACSTRSRLDWKCEMILTYSQKACCFFGLFFYASFFPEATHTFQLPVFPVLGAAACLWSQGESKGRFEEFCCLWNLFFTLCTWFLPGTNLHDGLWHSVNINARRHRITLTLDNNAATASHATTVSRIYSGNSYYFGGKLFHTDAGHIFMV